MFVPEYMLYHEYEECTGHWSLFLDKECGLKGDECWSFRTTFKITENCTGLTYSKRDTQVKQMMEEAKAVKWLAKNKGLHGVSSTRATMRWTVQFVRITLTLITLNTAAWNVWRDRDKQYVVFMLCLLSIFWNALFLRSQQKYSISCVFLFIN